VLFSVDPSVEGSGDELIHTDIAQGRGVQKLSTWTPPPIFVDKRERERGNFIHVWGFEDFAVDAKTCRILKPILEETCELLPFLPLEGEQYYRINVLNTVDCLDEQKTKWRMRPNGTKSTQIEEFQFNPTRFNRHTLFKLPKRIGLLTVTGLGDEELEFKFLVENAGLTGLRFEEIWNS
jgi:hypothetical protein